MDDDDYEVYKEEDDTFNDNHYNNKVEVEKEDLVTKLSNINYRSFLNKYYIQIWMAVCLIIICRYYYNGYRERKRIENQKKQPFNKEIVEKNDENVRLARLKSQEAFREDLKTMPIPKESANESNFDYTKKVKTTTTTTTTTNKKFTEGLNPSGSGRLSFNNLGTKR